MASKLFNFRGIGLLAVLLVVTSCKSSNSETEASGITYWINSSKVPCEGVAPMECLEVRQSESADWQLFYSEIEGFDYQPGYLYRIKVREEKRDPEDVPADASSIRYILVSVEEKTPE
ncbi:MAG: DUF4377 domain-containing protein [Robiginitalea sp.]|jgi:hypothetical protein|uniref:DUF4377 domain-containing protein n=2 Tax=Robiginitalea sp. TaxID=1902411 RepID=UPI003C73C0DE